ncbi:rod shape-determining protein [Actinoplanes sp. CA-252034]|uniref:rod shape-determining protein n=1 Tax=Actinoplanes sp. CA-252034 TaxID=3239906 RepID=UPI003D989A9D
MIAPIEYPADVRHPRRDRRPAAPRAVAVDLGSSTTGVWASHHGIVNGPNDDTVGGRTLMRRGRVTDVEGCVTRLEELIRQYPQPMHAPDLVVACRPVLSTDADLALLRQVLDTAFAPRRTLFIDTVRAAAIGAGATAGSLLIADVGAELTEVALLEDGHVTEARRTDVGTRDLDGGTTTSALADIVAGHLGELRASCPGTVFQQATARGLLLVGDGAAHPRLSTELATGLGMRVHLAVGPRATALNGAGLAAASALRHPGLN